MNVKHTANISRASLPATFMQRWKNLILNNFTIERFDKSIDIYKNISPKQLQELANKYLIEEDFYKKIQRVLCKDGIFIAQSGSKFFMNDELEKARSNLSKVFTDVHTYYSPMLVYPGVIWSYTAAGDKLLNKKNSSSRTMRVATLSELKINN